MPLLCLCRIEETWRLWCKFLDDYSRFEDWLKMAERTAANPNSADVLYTVAKEELKKFEVSCGQGWAVTDYTSWDYNHLIPMV